MSPRSHHIFSARRIAILGAAVCTLSSSLMATEFRGMPVVGWFGAPSAAAEEPTSPSVYRFKVMTIDGKEVSLEEYKGKVLLIVNVASKCGFTPQYKGLQALYQEFQDEGLVILGFPANNFGKQEPGSNEEIRSFCSTTYGVTFPMFAKISVAGEDIHPLYKFLTEKTDFSGPITWNFNKFLVDRNGRVVEKYGSMTSPDAPKLREKVQLLLAAKP